MERRFDKFYALLPPDEVAGMLNMRLMADAGIEEYFTMALRHRRSSQRAYDALVQAGPSAPVGFAQGWQHRVSGRRGAADRVDPGRVVSADRNLNCIRAIGYFLYSDGFTECHLAEGGLLEEEGLRDMALDSATGRGGSEFLDDLVWRLTQLMSPDGGMCDDVSAVYFEYNGVP